MPQIIPAVIGALTAIGSAVTVGAVVGGAAAAIGAAVIVGGVLAAKTMIDLSNIRMPKVDSDASRQKTVRSTTEPYKIIYGETLVSGPISYIGMKGTDNEDLYHVIALAGHEVTDITNIHFDNQIILDSAINGGSSDGGNVTSGTFGPKGGTTICIINKHLGTATQAADSMMVSAFTDYTSDHQGKGVAYIAMKWKLNEDSAEVWDKYAPTDIKALVQGKKVYDPRLEYAAVSTYGQDVTNASYIAYSTNPSLCLVDYLMDADFGMGIAAAKIDWNAIVAAADGCEVSVVVPGGNEQRFTCNGVLFGTDSHRANINKILSSMNGSLVYSNGKYVVRAGIYEAPTESLDENDLVSAIGVKTSFERSDRYNTVKGLFIDPNQNYKSSEFPKVQLADAVSRDNGEVLEKEVQFPMTNSSYMAQRLANKLIQSSDQQKVVSFPANLSALRITAGDRVQVSVEELSWSNKVFQCVGWTFSEEGGVNLTLKEDSSTAYSDPASNEYSTVTATGDITDAFRGVPSPSGLSATAGLKSNELNWVNPAKPNDFGTIYVYASPNGNFSSAVKIGETDGTQFIHDASNSADSVVSGDVRYYWVRAVRNVGTDAASQSNLEPNADPNTTVFATVGRVNWADVAGSTDAPADNATVGAQLSVNLYDANGSTVLSDVDVKNSILAQEILEVEVEAGEVLSLETGQDVDIQNLGDVAIYVSDSNQTLNTSINTVANGLSALEDTIIDITSGSSSIFIQATPPVAGVGGIPDPIPEFSRWYDSDDNNHPYYWTGSAWADLADPRIGQNASSIININAVINNSETGVVANANAIDALDVLTIAQGESIVSIAGRTTNLESTVNNVTTGVVANANAVSSLTTITESNSASISSQATLIDDLTADLGETDNLVATKASSSALGLLDARVEDNEGDISSQASSIEALESTVNNAETGVVANSDAVSALTTRVEDNEEGVLVNAGAVTTLNATYTEDLHFRTQAEDENDDLIDLETSGTVELQDLTDFVAGSSAAIQSLTVQTVANEDGIQTQAIQLTALESTVNDPTNGVVATAGALSSLSTTVSVIDGQVTSTAQDLTTLSTTVGDNTSSITTQATSIDGVEANYSVKIDNNNRITGFGLLSTTSGATPFSEFAVVADQFSIVSPDSTADTPIQPFTVTADKIYFGADVIVSGDLISTGTISADRLQIDGVMFDTETVGGVTSLIIKESGINTSQIAESAITTARLSNDAVTVDKFANTLQSTNYVADTSGWQILTSGDVEFQNAKITGDIVAETLTVTEANITGTLTLGGGVLQDGSGNNLTTITTLNANQTFAEVSGASAFYRITTNTATAPTNAQFDTEAGRFAKVNDIVITTDTTTTPDTTYGWTCTVAGGASTEATWEEITDFISGDLLVDGTITADQIAANTITANEIVSNAIGTGQLTVGVGTTLGLADTASQVNAGLALLLNKDTFGNANTGEASLVSVDKGGNPLLEDATTTSNGFIQWNGSKITVEAVQYTSSSTVKFTVLTGLADKRGFIVFDTTKSNPFTVDGVAMDVAFAFKEGAQWYYDNNITATTFTPTNDMVALGYLETGTGDLILKGGLINPVTLTAAAFPSDIVKSGSIGGVLITPTTIESNFVTGVSGFQLKSDGTLEAGNGTFRGAINATSLTLSSGITIAKSVVGLTNVENLDAQNQAQTGLIAGTTITGGGIIMSAGGAIKTTGKDSESNTTNGFFLGYNGTNYTFGVGDATQSMQWNGSDLSVTGAITATSLNVTDATITGSISANNIKIDNVTLDTDGAGNLIIATDGVDTGQIKAGAVTPTEMTVTSLAAITADLGTVTAGSLDAGIITGDVNESNVIQNATSLSFNGPSDEVTILEGSVAASTGDGHKIFSVCSGYIDSTSSKVYWIRMYLRDTPTSSYVLTSTTKVKATTDIATPFTIAGGTTAVKTGEVGVKITIRRYGSNGITPDGATGLDYVRERTCFIEGVR
jgi:hypothetical protein